MDQNKIFADWVDAHEGDSLFARLDRVVALIGFSRTYLYEVYRGDKSVSRNVAAAVHEATDGQVSRDSLLFGWDQRSSA